MRRLRLICGLIVVLLSSPLAAEQALLWQVESPRGAISFLFGTIHSDDPRVLDLPKPVTLAFDKAKTVVLEMDLGQASQGGMGQVVMLPQGKSLADLIPASLYRDTVKLMSTLGYPEEVTRQLAPWAIQLTLSMPPPTTGMFLDAVLYEQAVAAHKRVVGLETMEEQISIFRDLSASDQVTLLQQALDEYPQLAQQIEQLKLAWLNRDLEKMGAMSQESMEELPAGLQQRFGRSLVERRNHRMAERSLPMLREGGAFIAVGTMHLIGEEGLVALLRGEGMKVTAVY